MVSRSVICAMAAAALALSPTGARAQGPAAAKGKTEITWYGHSAFVVRTPGGTVLAIDPWFQNPKSPDKEVGAKLEKVDRILLTHGHSDHVGEAIDLAKRTGAKVIANNDLTRTLIGFGLPKEQAGPDSVGNIGGAIEIGDATVLIVPAAHSSQFTGENGAQLPGGVAVGFVIKVKGGPTLYHTGDTDVIQDMKQIPERYGPVDVMLACIGGQFTMDPAGAALAATYVKAKIVVPMHFGTNPAIKGTPKDLEAALKGRAKVLVLEPGKPAMF